MFIESCQYSQYECDTWPTLLPHNVKKRRFNTLHVVTSQNIQSCRWDGPCGITKAGTICQFLLRETPRLVPADTSGTHNPLGSLIYNARLYRVKRGDGLPV